MLVQHLVVLEIVQERGRRIFRVAGEKNRRPRHDVRRLLFQTLHQRLERHFRAPRLEGQQPRPAPPRGHDQHDREAEHDRNPRAFQDIDEGRGDKDRIDENERHHQRRRAPERPAPLLPHHDEAEHAGRPFRRGHRQHIGRRQRAGGAEHDHEQQDADQQDEIDARHVDLAEKLRGGVPDFEARQQAELHRLPRQGIGTRDDGLARDRRGSRGEDDQRQAHRFRRQQIERIGERRRVGQDQRALPEIIQQQRRQDEQEPRRLDRLAAEMPEVGVERLRPGHDQEDGTERNQPDEVMVRDEREPVPRVDRVQHRRIVGDVNGADHRHHQEPEHGDRRKQRRYARRAVRLHREQRHQNDDRERQDERREVGLHDPEALDRRHDRERRRDQRRAIEHRRADDAEAEHQRRAPAERAEGERHQRERAALPVVVGAQQDKNVFAGDDDDQRPDNERQDAEDDVASEHALDADGGVDRFAECVERAGADVAVDDADAAEGQSPVA